MLGDVMRRDAMRCSSWKEDAGSECRRLSKDGRWTREGTNGGWNCGPVPGTGTGRGGRGLMTSEVNRKRKSSGYVATGWDRSTRFVSSGLLVSFELTRQCQLGRGPLDLGHLRSRHRTLGLWTLGPWDLQSSVSFQFWVPISAPSSFPLLVPTRQLCVAACVLVPYAAVLPHSVPYRPTCRPMYRTAMHRTVPMLPRA